LLEVVEVVVASLEHMAVEAVVQVGIGHRSLESLLVVVQVPNLLFQSR